MRTGYISPDAVGLSGLPWVNDSMGACVPLPQWRAVGLRVLAGHAMGCAVGGLELDLGSGELGLGTRDEKVESCKELSATV
jgi:hypothetical protein